MNIRLIEGQGAHVDPVQDERDRVARRAALDALAAFPAPEPLDTVGYRSAGHALVIGARADALPWAERIAAVLPVTVLLLDGDAAADKAPRLFPVFAARALVLTGWLGAFDATWQSGGSAPEHARFDLVLDLGASPQIATHQSPHGYVAPGTDDAARQAAVDTLLDMVGEFEKPKYFAYKERLCAHGRNRKTGCNACIEICSAGAIADAGDLIAVNPYLCAGCGACTTVCPTGALGYVYPSAAHTDTRIKAALRAFAQEGGRDAVLLVHGAEGAALLAQLDAAGQVPGRVLPLGVHHTASTGIDIWLAALAWGAAGVTVLMTDAEAPQYAAALEQQMTIAQTIMTGLGYAGLHMRLLRVTDAADLAPALRHAPGGQVPARPAGFNVAADKRNTLDYALEHLLREAPQPAEEIALPAGSPFGALDVDATKCSLCMACVGACPAAALQDGQNAPQLRFIEKNCVQCSLCVDTCPEDAIRLVPRLSFRESRKQPVVLTETQPFHCIRCDKPFGTLRMVESMLARLAGHPAFAGHLDRMRMCGDCRVIDMMAPKDEQTIHQAHELRRR
jgi:Na+-translocating ferredoxin:NAD+ oxidoreductase RNF subunit RnfB